jgi:hypothetical protein
MARPARIEKLAHGKILCGAVFRFFVETWNWLTGYVDNLRGDYDENRQNGYIHVDRTNPDSPVIRLRTDRLLRKSQTLPVTSDGPFFPIYDEEGEDPLRVIGFGNCYWQNGGVTCFMADQSCEYTDGFVVLQADATTSGNGSASLESYSTLSDLNEAQQSPAFFIAPLYYMEEGHIVMDMRRLPQLYLLEAI